MLNQAIKQRLIGAAVLMGVGIVAIPFLLQDPTEITLQSESKDYYETHQDFSSAVEVSPDNKQGKSATFVSNVKLLPEQDLPILDNSDQGETSSFSSPAAKSTSVSSSEPRSSAPFESSGKKAGWLIQIGSFSHKRNALRLRDNVISSGYKAFVETARRERGIIYKVRVGPEKEAAHARVLKQKLERQLQTKAFIISPSDG